ncbi:alpha/beta hydrolase [Elizabethkingia meningoseptica]
MRFNKKECLVRIMILNKIYIFSGLGVDKRVFDKIDFGNLNVEFVDWIIPVKNETLKDYAKRISLSLTAENPSLIGLSFGGILAVEISKLLKYEKVILIASAKSKNELPWIYQMSGKIKINKLLPVSVFKLHNFITDWFFGVEKASEKQMLKNILKDTNSVFLKWAINEIVNWKNMVVPENCIHIHGNKDRVIPLKNIKADYILEGGGHFMTVNKSKEIEIIIREICEKD